MSANKSKNVCIAYAASQSLMSRVNPYPVAASEQSTKKRSPISIEIKKPSTIVGVSALASPTHSPASDKEKDNVNKEKETKDKDKDKDKEKDSKKSRREELLKQLRAVEDAIAKKRSKLT